MIDHEISAILSCMAKAGLPEDQVKFTYIIVNKKINTREGDADPQQPSQCHRC